MENWKTLKQLIEDMEKNIEKGLIDGKKASAKRARKQTLQLRELVTKLRTELLSVYRTPTPEVAE